LYGHLTRHFRSFARFEVIEPEPEIPARMNHMPDNFRRPLDEFGVADGLIDPIREFVSCRKNARNSLAGNLASLRSAIILRNDASP